MFRSLLSLKFVFCLLFLAGLHIYTRDNNLDHHDFIEGKQSALLDHSIPRDAGFHIPRAVGADGLTFKPSSLLYARSDKDSPPSQDVRDFFKK